MVSYLQWSWYYLTWSYGVLCQTSHIIHKKGCVNQLLSFAIRKKKVLLCIMSWTKKTIKMVYGYGLHRYGVFLVLFMHHIMFHWLYMSQLYSAVFGIVLQCTRMDVIIFLNCRYWEELKCIMILTLGIVGLRVCPGNTNRYKTF